MKCTGRSRMGSISVTEIALVSGRETRGVKRRLMIALAECMNNGPNNRYRSPKIV